VRRAHLGVGVQEVGLPSTLAESLGRHSGLLVMSVQPGSAAERAGLLLGDLLLDLGDARLACAGDLELALAQAPLGQTLELSLVRGGARQRLAVSAEERP